MAQIANNRLSSPRFAWACEDIEDDFEGDEERDVMPAAAPQPVVLQLSHAKSWHLAESSGGGLCGSHLLTTQAHDVDSKQRHDMSPPSPRWSRKHSASKIYPEVMLSSTATERSSSIVSLPSHSTDEDRSWCRASHSIDEDDEYPPDDSKAGRPPSHRPPTASSSMTMEVSTSTPKTSRPSLGRLLRNSFNRPPTASRFKDAKQIYEGLELASQLSALNLEVQLRAHLQVNGSTASVRDGDGDRYPLHWAAARGNARCVELLMTAGADLDAVDREGRTAAELAFAHGHASVHQRLTVGLAAVVPAAASSRPASRGVLPYNWQRGGGADGGRDGLEPSKDIPAIRVLSALRATENVVDWCGH